MALELIVSLFMVAAVIIISLTLILLLSALLLLHFNRRCTHHQMFNLSEKIPEYLETKCQSNPDSAPGLSSHRECDKTDRFSWIGSNIPCFKLSGKQVNVLTEPTQFFETLKVSTIMFCFVHFFFRYFWSILFYLVLHGIENVSHNISLNASFITKHT